MGDASPQSEGTHFTMLMRETQLLTIAALSVQAPPSPICPGRSGDDPLSSLPSSAVLSGSEGSEYYLEMADSSLELVEPLPASRLPVSVDCFPFLTISAT